MCGIAGILNLNGAPVPAATLSEMTHALVHRGPDDEGFYINDSVGLGQRRLSIIDIPGGHQPLANEDGKIWIIFNGEIYNFRFLRSELQQLGHQFKTNTDTEVIIHAFEAYGAGCVEKLWGMFAFALWDSERQQLFLARDRLGKKPLYYYQHNGYFIFASEIKALLRHPEVQRDVDLAGLDDYLHYGFIPGPATIYRRIRKLLPGHWARLDIDGTWTMKRYWEYPLPRVEANSSPDTCLNELRHLIEDAVRIRLISDVPLGAFLSGGLDSSIVVAAMSRNIQQPVKTFNIGFAEKTFDESAYARKVASVFDTEHIEQVVSYDIEGTVNRIVRHFDEPFADSSAIPAYYLSQVARRNVTVAMSGDGGDEVFGGYSRYAAQRLMQTVLKMPAFLRRAIGQAIDRMPEGTQNRSENLLKQIKWVLRAAEQREQNPLDLVVNIFSGAERGHVLNADVRQALKAFRSDDELSFVDQIAAGGNLLDRVSQMMWTDAQTYLVDDILVKIDRMSMAHSLEVRCPFLDHRLIEFMARIPVDLKVRGAATKVILKRYAKPFLPKSIVYRRKRGFSVPIGKWVCGPLRPMVSDLLLGSQVPFWLDPAEVCSLVNRHLAGIQDNGTQIWTLLVLALWARETSKSDTAFAGANVIGNVISS